MLQEEGRYSEVEELFTGAFTLANGVHAQNATLLCSRGFFRGWQGRWNAAARDLAQALEVEPAKYWTWYLLAPVLAQSGDLPAYQKHCHAMLARFGATGSPVPGLLTAVACALRPVTGVDLDKASKLADKAVSISIFDMSSPGYATYPWTPLFLLGKGLIEYRQGHCATAVNWLRRALSRVEYEALANANRKRKGEVTFSDLDLDVRKAQTQFVLAMALYQLKDPSEAREAFEQGKSIVEGRLPGLSSGDLTDRWPDVLIANSLMREAMQLIESRVTTEQNNR
jgi:tetratricopeptide (TPR) repeat protein